MQAAPRRRAGRDRGLGRAARARLARGRLESRSPLRPQSPSPRRSPRPRGPIQSPAPQDPRRSGRSDENGSTLDRGPGRRGVGRSGCLASPGASVEPRGMARAARGVGASGRAKGTHRGGARSGGLEGPAAARAGVPAPRTGGGKRQEAGATRGVPAAPCRRSFRAVRLGADRPRHGRDRNGLRRSEGNPGARVHSNGRNCRGNVARALGGSGRRDRARRAGSEPGPVSERRIVFRKRPGTPPGAGGRGSRCGLDGAAPELRERSIE